MQKRAVLLCTVQKVTRERSDTTENKYLEKLQKTLRLPEQKTTTLLRSDNVCNRYMQRERERVEWKTNDHERFDDLECPIL